MSTETQKVDVLAGFTRRADRNWPSATGDIANRLRFRPRAGDGRVVKHKTPTTATVLRMLVKAEREGLVIDVGCGTEHRKTWRDLSAAEAKERYWILTDTAINLIRSVA